MHELTIAQNLVEIVCQHATEQKATQVTSIHLRLGELSGFNRALYFCFDRVTKGTICEGAELHIETVDLTVHCDHCDATKRPGGRYNFRCPDCGMPTPKVVTGREMQIRAIRFDTAAPRPGSMRSDATIEPGYENAN